MKKICLFILSIVLFASQTFALMISEKTDTIKNSSVPKKILASFSKMLPNAKLVNWAKSNSIYIVSYRENNQNLRTTFDRDGKLSENKWKVLITDLPSATQDYIKKNNTQGIQEYYKIIDASGNVNYEVSSPNKSYFFNSNGEHYKTIELLKK